MQRLATLNYFRHHWFIILIRISVESLSPADASCSHRADSNPNKPCKSAFNPCVRSTFTNGSKCIEEPRKWSSELAKHYSTDWTRYLWRFRPQCFRKISNSWMHRTRLCACVSVYNRKWTAKQIDTANRNGSEQQLLNTFIAASWKCSICMKTEPHKRTRVHFDDCLHQRYGVRVCAGQKLNLILYPAALYAGFGVRPPPKTQTHPVRTGKPL